MFDRYIAAGDGTSIDLHPALDLVARSSGASHAPPPAGLGAASLLYRNDDARWSEFAGRDLEHLYPGIRFASRHAFNAPREHPTDHFATDGATTVGVLAYQLGRLAPDVERTLITLTAGAFDLRQMMGAPNPPPTFVAGMLLRIERALAKIRTLRPNALTLLATLPDPTDGTGDADVDDPLDRAVEWINEFNRGIVAIASASDYQHVRLADLHAHFFGHGTSAPPDERWFARVNPLDPGLRGASEIRRVWLETLGH